MSNDDRSTNDQLSKRLRQLKEKQQEASKVREKRELVEVEFQTAQRIRSFLEIFHPRTIKRTIRTIGAYILGRRNRRQLYSRSYKRKQASNDILPYINALYTKGFTRKALADLRTDRKERRVGKECR